jgi:hypothetical protein
MTSPRGPDAGGDGAPEKRGTRSLEREREEGCDVGDDAASVPQTRPPEGEPQPENPGGPCGRCCCRPNCRSCYQGGSGFWWEGRPEETGARSPERGAGREQRRRQQPLLRRLATADGHRVARIRRLLLPSGSLPLAPRGPTRRPLHRPVHLGLNRCCQRSSRRPTSRPKGGPLS